MEHCVISHTSYTSHYVGLDVCYESCYIRPKCAWTFMLRKQLNLESDYIYGYVMNSENITFVLCLQVSCVIVNCYSVK